MSSSLKYCDDCGTKTECVRTDDYGDLCAECVFRYIDSGMSFLVAEVGASCQGCSTTDEVWCADCANEWIHDYDENYSYCSGCSNDGIDVLCERCYSECTECAEKAIQLCISCYAIETGNVQMEVPQPAIYTDVNDDGSTITVDGITVNW